MAFHSGSLDIVEIQSSVLIPVIDPNKLYYALSYTFSVRKTYLLGNRIGDGIDKVASIQGKVHIVIWNIIIMLEEGEARKLFCVYSLLTNEHLYDNDNIQSQGTSLSIKIWILSLVVDNTENARGHIKMYEVTKTQCIKKIWMEM